MPRLKNYRLFISHAWKYKDDYDRLTRMLDEAKLFKWQDYSVPFFDPIGSKNDAQLRAALKNHIQLAQAVLIISGMYVNYREWIQYEMNVSKDYGKPIIGIQPRGSKRIPTEVQSAATTMVKWNTKSIVNAVRNHAIRKRSNEARRVRRKLLRPSVRAV